MPTWLIVLLIIIAAILVYFFLPEVAIVLVVIALIWGGIQIYHQVTAAIASHQRPDWEFLCTIDGYEDWNGELQILTVLPKSCLAGSQQMIQFSPSQIPDALQTETVSVRLQGPSAGNTMGSEYGLDLMPGNVVNATISCPSRVFTDTVFVEIDLSARNHRVIYRIPLGMASP